ncbi:MAG: hypothetical protein Q8R02_23425 [Hyphomonadaceae bacterium]|nr:hypothetical protein [Hyphomonadaceae bacterium]
MTPAVRAIVLGGLDADALLWQKAVVAAGGALSSSRLSLVSQTVRRLKQGGVWANLDRLWLFAAENSTQALIDLKARAVATAVNSPTFTASRGFAGDGATAYIDTGFNPATAGGNYVRDDACEGAWVETAQTASASAHHYMSYDEAIYTYIRQTNTTAYSFGVNNAAGDTSYTFVTQTGAWHAQRTASNAYALYQNGVSVQTGALTSAAVSSRNFFVLAGNNGGAPYLPTDGRLSGAWLGKSLTVGQLAAFYAAMRAYMTAVGVA